MTEFHAGGVIAGYTVIGLCGQGAYGEVYRVSGSLGAELALKLLPPGKAAERELDALIRFRACRHPNLLTVLHIGELPDGRIFYTMDLADPKEGSPEYSPDTLAARLTGGPFAPEEAERILRELLAGLNELHRARLLHRDIKPANILFIRGRAVLADIGLVADDASASLIGTPDYMPAELLKSHRSMTPADDCYALGLVLYCMLTGEPPSNFPGVPKTLRDPAALHLLKIAEKACTPPGFPDASAFLERLDRPASSGKKRGAWKWACYFAICRHTPASRRFLVEILCTPGKSSVGEASRAGRLCAGSCRIAQKIPAYRSGEDGTGAPSGSFPEI